MSASTKLCQQMKPFATACAEIAVGAVAVLMLVAFMLVSLVPVLMIAKLG